MTSVALSLAVVVLAVLAFPLLRRRAGLLSAVDGFVMVALGGLIAFDVLPFAVETLGLGALGLAALGALVPSWLERRSHLHTEKRAFVMLAITGLALHTFFDGTALAAADSGASGAETLATAVLVHRLPEGLVIGLLVGGPGSLRAWLAVALVSAGTLAGFAVGEGSLPALGVEAGAIYQALMAGMLGHVVFSHSPAGGQRVVPWAGALGALGGAVGLALLSEGHSGGGVASAGATFLRLAVESAPALLLAFVGAAVLSVALRPAHVASLSRGGPLGQALRGVAVGLPLPICSCGVLPLYDGLVRRGVPAAAATAFLVATPELGLDAVLLSWPLLGPELTIARVLLAAVAALVVALVVSWGARPVRPSVALVEPWAAPERGFRAVLRRAFVSQADHLLPWILVGLAMAAWAEPLLTASSLPSLAPWAQVPLAAALGLPVYVCASGSTPLVAVMLASGLSPGAGLAFLLTGPATNVTTFGVLSSLHGKARAFRFGATMFAASVGAGWLANAWLGAAPALAATQAVLDEAPGVVGWCAAAVLGLAALGSLFRRGPRGWVAELARAMGFPEHRHGPA